MVPPEKLSSKALGAKATEAKFWLLASNTGSGGGGGGVQGGLTPLLLWCTIVLIHLCPCAVTE